MSNGMKLSIGDKIKQSRETRLQRERRERIEDIEQQVSAGTLVIRKMTPAERKKWPPLENQKLKKRYNRDSIL